jgi:serine/threonine protein kinase
VKVCPRCFTRFPDGERFCLHDSAVLVEEEDIARLGTSIGNYRLDKILGRGGMGTVYSGEHVYIKKAVAVKVLRRSTGSCARRARRRRSTTRTSSTSPTSASSPTVRCTSSWSTSRARASRI